jgi:cyanate permease
MAFNAPMGMLAPVYSGWVYDTTGNYATALLVFAFLAGGAVLVTGLVSTPKLTESEPGATVPGITRG